MSSQTPDQKRQHGQGKNEQQMSESSTEEKNNTHNTTDNETQELDIADQKLMAFIQQIVQALNHNSNCIQQLGQHQTEINKTLYGEQSFSSRFSNGVKNLLIGVGTLFIGVSLYQHCIADDNKELTTSSYRKPPYVKLRQRWHVTLKTPYSNPRAYATNTAGQILITSSDGQSVEIIDLKQRKICSHRFLDKNDNNRRFMMQAASWIAKWNMFVVGYSLIKESNIQGINVCKHPEVSIGMFFLDPGKRKNQICTIMKQRVHIARDCLYTFQPISLQQITPRERFDIGLTIFGRYQRTKQQKFKYFLDKVHIKRKTAISTYEHNRGKPWEKPQEHYLKHPIEHFVNKYGNSYLRIFVEKTRTLGYYKVSVFLYSKDLQEEVVMRGKIQGFSASGKYIFIHSREEVQKQYKDYFILFKLYKSYFPKD